MNQTAATFDFISQLSHPKSQQLPFSILQEDGSPPKISCREVTNKIDPLIKIPIKEKINNPPVGSHRIIVIRNITNRISDIKK